MAVQTQIQTRRGTAASWTSTNPTLAAGEIGFETDTGKFKIGNGSTAWASLAYATNGAAVSPLTTKGDLYTYSTADARLAVGNNGETLVADSSTSTGLRYNPSQAAGKNAVINGDFDIWQRGTSSTSNGTYNTADRWWNYTNLGTNTWSRESTIVPTGSLYSMKSTQSVATATNWQMNQAIETLNAVQFAGKTVTLSAQFCASASTTVFIAVSYSTSTDVAPTGSWTGITATSGTTSATSATTASFTQLSGQYAIPSTAKSLLVVVGSSSVASGTSIYVGKVQLELGLVQTAFTKAGGTIQGELAACQRYYTRLTGGQAYSMYGIGFGRASGATADVLVNLPVTMRVIPTVLEYGNIQLSVPGSAGATITAITTPSSGDENSQYIGALAVSATVTAAKPYFIGNNNNAAGYLAFGAEL